VLPEQPPDLNFTDFATERLQEATKDIVAADLKNDLPDGEPDAPPGDTGSVKPEDACFNVSLGWLDYPQPILGIREELQHPARLDPAQWGVPRVRRRRPIRGAMVRKR